MPEERDEAAAILADEILRYLTAHPNAADSREGIERWWLQGSGSSVDPTLVQKALDLLVQKRLLNRTELAGGQVIYSRVAAN